jgi:signal transduction histidine kinase
MTSVSDAPAPAGRERRFHLGLGAWSVLILLTVCAAIAAWSQGDAADAAGSLGFIVGITGGGVLFLTRSRHLEGRERLGWSLVGIGMLTALAGVVTVAVLHLSGGNPPAFGWPDLFFFTAYALIILGFASLPHTWGSSMHRWRIALDGLIGAVSVGALLWVFILTEMMKALESAPIWQRVIGATYPFLDLALITVGLLVLLRRSVYRFDIRLLLVTVGLTAQAFGDVAFFLEGAGGSFEDATPLYVLNILAGGCLLMAAYLLNQPQSPREYAERKAPLWALLMPYGAAVAMVVAMLLHPTDLVLLYATLIVGALVVARQGVSITENRQMVEQQRNALVSSISHELRTPLTSIVGFVELLEQEGETMSVSSRREMVGIVHQQVGYMSRIVADLIMLARGNPNEIQLEISEVDVNSLLRSSIHGAGIDPLTVAVECEEGLVGYFDADRLQQVVVNLVTNASRYGGPHRVIVAAASRSDLLIEVHDDGPGIPRRYELTVWERFERGPNRLNATVPGSGIGLAVVDAIARAHGGVAEYRRSERLGGACFTVTLPGRAVVRQHTDATEADSLFLSPPLA